MLPSETVKNFDVKWEQGLAINIRVGDLFNREIGPGWESAFYIVMHRWLRPNRTLQLHLFNCEPPNLYNCEYDSVGRLNLAYHKELLPVDFETRAEVGYIRLTDDLLEEWLTSPFINIRIAAKKYLEVKDDPNNRINQPLRCRK